MYIRVHINGISCIMKYVTLSGNVLMGSSKWERNFLKEDHKRLYGKRLSGNIAKRLFGSVQLGSVYMGNVLLGMKFDCRLTGHRLSGLTPSCSNKTCPFKFLFPLPCFFQYLFATGECKTIICVLLLHSIALSASSLAGMLQLTVIPLAIPLPLRSPLLGLSRI